MPKISPRISTTTAIWLEELWGTKNAGAEFLLEALPQLYRRCMAELHGKFTGNELALLIDTFNSTMLSPSLLGQQLEFCAEDSMDLDHTHTKWDVDRNDFMSQIITLTLFERACLEIFVKGYWENQTNGEGIKKPGSLEQWVGRIASRPLEV